MSTSNAMVTTATQEPVSRSSEIDEQITLDAMPLLITVPRAAELLGISRSACYRCAATGELPRPGSAVACTWSPHA